MERGLPEDKGLSVCLREPGADKEQNVHSDRFQETARGGCGPPTAGPFPARRPAGGLPGRGPWKRANPVTRCRLGRGPEKGGKEKGRERRQEGGMGGGLGPRLVWSVRPWGRPKPAMLLLEPIVPPLGATQSLPGPCSVGLGRYKGRRDEESGPSPVWVSNQQRGSGLVLPRAAWRPQPGPSAPSAWGSDATPSSGGGAVVSPGAWGGARALWLCVRFPRVCGSQTPNLPLGLFKGFHFLCIVRIFSVPIQWYNKCPDSTPPPSCP